MNILITTIIFILVILGCVAVALHPVVLVTIGLIIGLISSLVFLYALIYDVVISLRGE